MVNWFLGLIENFSTEFYRNLIVEDRWLMILKGLGITIEISILSILIGTVLGFALCIMRISNIKILSKIATWYINVFRGTPLITQLLIINFGVFASVNLNTVIIAVIAFSMNSGAYVAEIIRAGILSVDSGQTEAGRSLGLNGTQTMMYIVLPQAIKNCLPTYASEFIVLIKETAIVGYIAIEDLTKVGDIIRSRTFSAFFPLVTVALVYFVITYSLSKLFSKFERRLRLSDKR
ncbi:MAG: amino acid ABC transporter permease [Clostridiales bacterium]|nr:amino acid ABC transporter permease [Clostridiales bacterium]